jgi:hypothetical protein
VKHRMFVCPAAFVLALAGADRVTAQGPRVGTATPAPALSPYLNLNRPGNTPGFNYVTLVRPMVAGNAALQNLQQQITAAQVAGTNGQGALADSLTTGHAVMFLNTGGYFQSTGGSMNPARAGNQGTGQSAPAAGRSRSGPR